MAIGEKLIQVSILKKRIKHNGDEYLFGQKYDLTEAMADAWINAGYATKVWWEEKTDPPKVEPIIPIEPEPESEPEPEVIPEPPKLRKTATKGAGV